MDAGVKKRLRGIDISDADDDRVVHDSQLDGTLQGAQSVFQIAGLKSAL